MITGKRSLSDDYKDDDDDFLFLNTNLADLIWSGNCIFENFTGAELSELFDHL